LATWQADLLSNPPANGRADVRWRAEQVNRPGHVEKGFVDGNPFDEGGEIAQHLDHLVAQLLIPPKLPADKAETGAETARPPSRHARMDSERPGFVGRRQHHPAADRDRPAPQGRLEQLLDGRVERVQVGVQDGGGSAGRHVAQA
jgi:hypothetical protein